MGNITASCPTCTGRWLKWVCWRGWRDAPVRARGSRIPGASPLWLTTCTARHTRQTHRRRALQTPGGTFNPSSSSKHHEEQVDWTQWVHYNAYEYVSDTSNQMPKRIQRKPATYDQVCLVEFGRNSMALNGIYWNTNYSHHNWFFYQTQLDR